MGKIYVNQSKLRLQLNTGVDIVQGDVLEIRYRKPNSAIIYSFTATELSTTKGAIYYDFKAGDLNVAGVWTFWAFITFAGDSDGGFAPGEPINIRIYNEGK